MCLLSAVRLVGCLTFLGSQEALAASEAATKAMETKGRKQYQMLMATKQQLTALEAAHAQLQQQLTDLQQQQQQAGQQQQQPEENAAQAAAAWEQEREDLKRQLEALRADREVAQQRCCHLEREAAEAGARVQELEGELTAAGEREAALRHRAADNESGRRRRGGCEENGFPKLVQLALCGDVGFVEGELSTGGGMWLWNREGGAGGLAAVRDWIPDGRPRGGCPEGRISRPPWVLRRRGGCQLSPPPTCSHSATAPCVKNRIHPRIQTTRVTAGLCFSSRSSSPTAVHQWVFQ